MLSLTGLKNQDYVDYDDHKQLISSPSDEDDSNLIQNSPIIHHVSNTVQAGVKGLWRQLDDNYLQVWFGGAHTASLQSLNERGGSPVNRKFQRGGEDDLGDYELSTRYESDDDDDEISF